MELYEVKAMLSADVNSFMSGISEALGALQDFQSGANELEGVTSVMRGVGAGLTLGVTAPLVGLAAVSAKVFMGLDENLRTTMATMGQYVDESGNFTGQSAKDYELLKEKSKEWGQESIYTSAEVAGAMAILAARGGDMNDILEQTPGVINLAAAAGMKGASGIEAAAHAVGSAMQQFQSQGLESTHVADVFAKVAANTALQNMDLADALSYVGVSAATNGLTFEETAAALGVMADAGLRSEQSGRYLNMALTKMAKPTKEARILMDELGISFFDSEGNMKTLSENVDMLREAFADLTPEQRQFALATLFGQEAGRGMNALIEEGTGKLEWLTDELINSEGAAEDMADTINSGLSGAMEKMMEAITNALATIGEVLEPTLLKWAESIENLMEKFNELDPTVQESIVQILALVAAIGPLLTIFSFLISPIVKVGGALKTLIGFLISNPWVLFAAAAVAAVVLIVQNWEGIAEFFSNLWETIKTSASELWESITSKFSEGAAKLKENWEQIKENAIQSNEEMKAKLESIWEGIKTAISTAWENIKTQAQSDWNAIKSTLEGIWNNIKTAATTAFNNIKDAISKAWENVKSKSSEIWNSIKTSVETIWNNLKTSATSKFNEIKEAISKAWENVKSKTTETWNNIKQEITNAVENIKTTVQNGWDNLVTTVTTKGEEIVSSVRTAWDNAVSAAREFVSSAISVGRDIIGGFVSGVVEKAGELATAAARAVGNAIDAAKRRLGIKSPSRVFMDIGDDTMAGFIIGIEDKEKDAIKTMGSLMQSVIGVGNKGEFDFANKLSNLNGSVNGNVEHSIKNNNAMNQPANLILRLGNKEYRAFVEDITNAQGQEAQLIEKYGF